MLWNVDVWREMERLRREMDGLFNDYGRAAPSAAYPLINVYENDDNVVVTAELPGATRDKVSITFSDGVLTISGKQEKPASVKNMTPLRVERADGNFEKTVRIATKIDQNSIAATFSDGILTITMPKAEEAKPKTITIEAK